MIPTYSIACVLLDLDGTLLDTAPDMSRALNRLRLEQAVPALPLAQLRPLVSHGSAGLIRFGFGLTPQDPGFVELRRRFLDLYAGDLASETTLFSGMAETLTELENRNIPWGIVTNKPGWLTDPLLQALQLRDRAACVVSGDTTPRAKPDPQPLLYACRQLDIPPRHCLYVGDAERDVQAGQRAGMSTLVARYGYLHRDERPQDWGADGLIDSPRDLLDWLIEHRRGREQRVEAG